MNMFELPKLDYPYDALEPFIDAQTMEIHYSKHHASYISNLNKALEKYPDLQKKTIEHLISNFDEMPQEIRTVLRNNGGGHYNHSLFWKILTPTNQQPSVKILSTINHSFNSFDMFKELFTQTAMSRFGSGWAWLAIDNDKNLKVFSTPNQDNPLMDGMAPVLGLDVWEHAYYLKYQNRRADYISAWWNVVNWEQVEYNLNQSHV